MATPKILRLSPLAMLVGLGLVSIGYVIAQEPAPQRAPAPPKAEDPANRGLDANLYMQTSAEYRACCYQAYSLATLRLKQILAESPQDANPSAVVLDLDETVFDNAGFQSTLLRGNLAYDQRLWDAWEEKFPDRVGLIPGAKDFILAASQAGVTPIYISNRNEKFREGSKKALARLGLPLKDEACLKLATDTSDKTKRRQEAEQAFKVLLYVGDNLRDFDEQFKSPKIETKDQAGVAAAIKARKDRVDAKRANWGDRWIILPNSAYGEWTRPLGLGKGDLDQLAPKIETGLLPPG